MESPRFWFWFFLGTDPIQPMHKHVLFYFYWQCKKNKKSYAYLWFQVIKAFDNPDFFNMVFPLLFEICNSSQVPSTSNVNKSGTDLISFFFSHSSSVVLKPVQNLKKPCYQWRIFIFNLEPQLLLKYGFTFSLELDRFVIIVF